MRIKKSIINQLVKLDASKPKSRNLSVEYVKVVLANNNKWNLVVHDEVCPFQFDVRDEAIEHLHDVEWEQTIMVDF
jgi:hypothetical protein